MTYLEKAKAMQHLMATVGSMEAFEKYYSDACIITEMPTGEKRIGKDAQREAIVQWFGTVDQYHGGGVDAITADEDQGITMVECWFDVTLKEGGRHTMKEVAVQQWQGEQIVDEKFYYNLPAE